MWFGLVAWVHSAISYLFVRTFSADPPQNQHADMGSFMASTTAESKDNLGAAFGGKMNFTVRLLRDSVGSHRGGWVVGKPEGFSLVDPMLLKHRWGKGQEHVLETILFLDTVPNINKKNGSSSFGFCFMVFTFWGKNGYKYFYAFIKSLLCLRFLLSIILLQVFFEIKSAGKFWEGALAGNTGSLRGSCSQTFGLVSNLLFM